MKSTSGTVLYVGAAVLAGLALWQLWRELQSRQARGAAPAGGTTDAQAAANRDRLWRELQSQPDFWI